MRRLPHVGPKVVEDVVLEPVSPLWRHVGAGAFGHVVERGAERVLGVTEAERVREDYRGQRLLQRFGIPAVGSLVVEVVEDEQPGHPIAQQAQFGKVRARIAVRRQRSGFGFDKPLVRFLRSNQAVASRPCDRVPVGLSAEGINGDDDLVELFRQYNRHYALSKPAGGHAYAKPG